MNNTNFSFVTLFVSMLPADKQQEALAGMFAGLPVDAQCRVVASMTANLQPAELESTLLEVLHNSGAAAFAAPADAPAAPVAADEAADEATDEAANAAVNTTNETASADEAANEAADEAADEAANEAANEAAAEAAEVAAAVRAVETVEACGGRPEVLLDAEWMPRSEVGALMRSVTDREYYDCVSIVDFMDGCTIVDTPRELLGDEVLDLRPEALSAPEEEGYARYLEMMRRIGRLIESHRCLLFEQVRQLTGYEFDEVIYQAMVGMCGSELERDEFLRKSRSRRLHMVAEAWIATARDIVLERRTRERRRLQCYSSY